VDRAENDWWVHDFPHRRVVAHVVSMDIPRVDAFAVRNHGLITRAASGLSDDAWFRAVSEGRFDGLHSGVARLPGTPRTPEQAIHAAVLVAGPDALASHRSAARLWGIPRPDDDRVDVMMLSRGSSPVLEGVDIHRPTDMDHLLPARRNSIRCTNVVRTLCDLGAVDPRGVSGAVGHALTSGLVTIGALEMALLVHGRRGRSGIGALRRATQHWTIDGKPADSVLEVAMMRLVGRYQLAPVVFHPTIEGYEIDFRVVGSAVVLECDGWTYHGANRRGFERDRERDARLIAAGWIPVRFTYRAVIRTPKVVAVRIRTAVDRWADRPAPDAVG
jgi:very-short-patch-repair endonuclease